MSDSITLYKNFDFTSCDDWNEYYNETLFPKPKGPLLEKFKRKWYQAKIDPKFDIYFDNIQGE